MKVRCRGQILLLAHFKKSLLSLLLRHLQAQQSTALGHNWKKVNTWFPFGIHWDFLGFCCGFNSLLDCWLLWGGEWVVLDAWAGQTPSEDLGWCGGEGQGRVGRYADCLYLYVLAFRLIWASLFLIPKGMKQVATEKPVKFRCIQSSLKLPRHSQKMLKLSYLV